MKLGKAVNGLSSTLKKDGFGTCIDTSTCIALGRAGVLFQFLWGVSEPPEAKLIHTLFKFHCLIHELNPTNHHSSQEHAIYGTSGFFLLS